MVISKDIIKVVISIRSSLVGYIVRYRPFVKNLNFIKSNFSANVKKIKILTKLENRKVS